MYMTTDEIEDPKRSQALISEALDNVICQEITDPDFANLTQEEVSKQLEVIGGQLNKLANVPRKNEIPNIMLQCQENI